MRTIQLTTLFCILLIGAAHSYKQKIVGGQQIAITEAPYQASVLYLDYHVCGGSILSPNWVVSASHCIYSTKPETYSIRVGSAILDDFNTEPYPVTQLYKHQNYNAVTYNNDIVLFKLGRSMLLDGIKRRAIALPGLNENVPDNTPCLVSGWGMTKNGAERRDNLRAVIVNTVNQQRCRDLYGKYITDGTLCAFAKGKDSCQGDSGGPLVANNKLVGIVSFGMACGSDGYPGVYARVAVFRDWIKKITNV